jgi:hypothetical protein
MVETVSSSLYEQVVSVARQYFGPAGRRFVDRQIMNHLVVPPEQLQKQDLAKLADWMALAMAVVVEDEDLIGNFSVDLQNLMAE